MSIPSPSRDWGPLFETIPQGIVVVNETGRFVDANRYASRILEMEPEDFLAVDLLEPKWRLFGSDNQQLSPEAYPIQEALRTRRPIHQRVIGLLEGEEDEALWLEVSVGLLPEGGAVVTFRDISERFRQESLLSARARIMCGATGGSLEDVLRGTIDEAERLTGSCIGFFHLVEADQVTLTLQAWSTRTSRDFCRAEGTGNHYAVDEAGVWVDCIREGRPVIHNDYASLPHRKGMPLGHATVIRELVVPVLREGRPVAILGVGNKPFAYGSKDVELVSRLADLGWDAAQQKRITG